MSDSDFLRKVMALLEDSHHSVSPEAKTRLEAIAQRLEQPAPQAASADPKATLARFKTMCEGAGREQHDPLWQSGFTVAAAIARLAIDPPQFQELAATPDAISYQSKLTDAIELVHAWAVEQGRVNLADSLAIAKLRKEVYGTNAISPTIPDCVRKTLLAAFGMSFGTDWNKGTAAGYHRKTLTDNAKGAWDWLEAQNANAISPTEGEQA